MKVRQLWNKCHLINGDEMEVQFRYPEQVHSRAQEFIDGVIVRPSGTGRKIWLLSSAFM